MTQGYGIRKVGPKRYREDPGRYFEDFEIGDIYEHWPGRTVTEADNPNEVLVKIKGTL